MPITMDGATESTYLNI